MKNRKAEDEDGFTLVELIVVVAILVILSAIAIPAYGKIQHNARQTAVETVANRAVTSVSAALSNDTGSATTADTAADALSVIDSKYWATVQSNTGYEDGFVVAVADRAHPEIHAYAGLGKCVPTFDESVAGVSVWDCSGD